MFNACVCVRLLAYLRACVADMLGGRGLIDYKYGLSDVFHSAGCIKMATGKWRNIYFRQDVRKIDFSDFFF